MKIMRALKLHLKITVKAKLNLFTMPNYTQGKIYKLTAGDLTYYGSTVKTLNDRFSHHKNEAKNNKSKSSQKLFETGKEVKIELIEDYPCKSKKELINREGYYIRNFDCVNKEIPGRTKQEYKKQYYKDNKDERIKQWREDNRDKIKEKHKQYYNDNKDEILEKNKQYQEANKDAIAEKKKQHYENNKDKIKAHRSEKIQCECGCMISKRNIARHCNSLKHKKYVESL